MIIEYLRPKTINEALKLLVREQPVSLPMGGGTVLNRGMDFDCAVIDLQALGLDSISDQGNIIQIGATVTLQKLLEYDGLSPSIGKVIELEATYNLRQMATIAGSLVTANGRSHLATALLALDANLEIQSLHSKPITIKLGDWLPMRSNQKMVGLITSVYIASKIHFSYEYISRTTADLPIVCAAVAQWKSGRTRLALGGWGTAPMLGMDGPEAEGIESAARDTYSLAEDQWGSSEYRQEMAGVLAQRCLKKFNEAV